MRMKRLLNKHLRTPCFLAVCISVVGRNTGDWFIMPKLAGSRISLYVPSWHADARIVPFIQAVYFHPQILGFSFILPIDSTGYTVWSMNTIRGKKFSLLCNCMVHPWAQPASYEAQTFFSRRMAEVLRSWQPNPIKHNAKDSYICKYNTPYRPYPIL